MIEINIEKIRSTLPERGVATLGKKNSICYIDCEVTAPPLHNDMEFAMVKAWQRQIVGKALSEFETFTEGSRWRIWLKRIPLTFTGIDDNDAKNFMADTIKDY